MKSPIQFIISLDKNDAQLGSAIFPALSLSPLAQKNNPSLSLFPRLHHFRELITRTPL